MFGLFLFTSSGAVYGKQPENITHVSEEYFGGPDISSPGGIYAEGKRMAEVLCSVYREQKKLAVKIARCYAFIGPFLPLDTHFAAGNFINNVIHNEDIIVMGDGTPKRSYLYAADLAVWLWTILLKGKAGYPYNVGSDEDVSIEELAKRIVAQAHQRTLKVNVMASKTNGPLLQYVPSIQRAKEELSLSVSIGLDEAIKKTIEFYS